MSDGVVAFSIGSHPIHRGLFACGIGETLQDDVKRLELILYRCRHRLA
jgi:hypothetical protein